MAPKDPERARAYQLEYNRLNADRKREAAQRWRDENRERSRQSRRDYVEANREAVLEDSRRRHHANRDEANGKRRLRRRRPGGKTPYERWRDTLIAALWPKQDGRCYLCGGPMNDGGQGRSSVVLEHDHRCCDGPKGGCAYCVRGLACANCNKIIGLASDDPDLLETIARNLRAKLAEMEDRLASKPQQLELGESA